MISTMINDYERRFQYSLQKLTIPSWYTEPAPSYKPSNKPLLVSTSHYERDVHRTPEIVHVQRPHSYRSYRSSIGTSPSPSVHSCYPNYMMDGTNFSSLLPSLSYNSRRHNKHEKGIERVTKSSQWYRPTQFIPKKQTDQISNPKISVIQNETSNVNHYDIPPKHDDDNKHVHSIKQNLISDKTMISELFIEEKMTNLTDNINGDDDQHKHHRNSNEIQAMPLADEKILFARVELEDVTDEEEESDNRSSTKNIHTVDGIVSDETNTLVEHLANNLVYSILNDVLQLKNFEQDDDTDAGVRELSDDENALREMDENDMSNADEFIVFASNAETFHDNDRDNETSSIIPRGSLNRLYIFSRTNDDGTIHSKLSSNQDSPVSTLMIPDKEFPITNSPLNIDLDQPTNTMGYLKHDVSNSSLPIYRSHIQKRHINLGRYYDGMMRAANSQIPTHDLRCNLLLHNANTEISSDGVNEETVRKGRLLLDSIPNTIELEKDIDDQSVPPVRSIIKNTRFALSDEKDEADEVKFDDNILKIEEREIVSPRKVITTTITEEYRRIQRQIIEEFDESILTVESNEEVCRDSDYSSTQERSNTQQILVPSVSINDDSPYGLLSECYSGYSYIRSDFLIPTESPFISNVSSLQSTTDEAYESEPTTTSLHSPTTSSSAAQTNYIHPDLEHEFQYPSPPPPVPDRRLKPAHLRPAPPPTKPRTTKQQQKQKDSNPYSKIKTSKTSPLTAIQHLIALPSNDSSISSARTLSSRHYCGSLPLANETKTSITTTNGKTDEIPKDNSKTFNHSNLPMHNDQTPQIIFTKSSTSSLNQSTPQRLSASYSEETTNGLDIQIPVPIIDKHDSTTKQNRNRMSTPSSSKQTEGTTRSRPVSENIERFSVYETSV
ncbi:unnamed protein product [Adineta steineri]|uniref:Uncharacterized protein n=1 Tax=Adineta steineri TaxID=433720 RepID=A0A818FM27_9BILA|nr:unnamed protein product [Adineta steineri]CAF3477095.1 unnamed protein product [Adineta steineri]